MKVHLCLALFVCINSFVSHVYTENISLNKPTSQKIVVATMKKTGSHLINKCIYLITGKEPTPIFSHVNWNTNFFWHHPQDANVAQWLHDQYRLLTIIRDPRDHIISVIRFRRPHVNKITFEGMQKEITGYLTNFAHAYALTHDGEDTIGGSCSGTTIDQVWKPFIDLLHNLRVCVVRFEHLIGPEGAGSIKTRQLEEIQRIADFIGVALSEAEICHVASHLYGGTATFARGGANFWKQYFTQEHKQLFKKSGNNALIQLGYEQDDVW